MASSVGLGLGWLKVERKVRLGELGNECSGFIIILARLL
jgi:hypothetical protein